jgi:hypothetical protein
MNRQVGPSIVLSVLIVVFFAVALFQQDAPRTAAPPSGAKAGPAIASSSPAFPRRSVDRSSLPVVKGDPKEASTESVSPQSRAVVHASSKKAAEITPAVARSIRAPAEPRTEPPREKLTERIGAAHQPRAAFVVVNAAETIEEVAWRVYGTNDQVDSLWRANRDALPRRDSPLTTGMVLRTPKVR